jgi:hypothetical protein
MNDSRIDHCASGHIADALAVRCKETSVVRFLDDHKGDFRMGSIAIDFYEGTKLCIDASTSIVLPRQAFFNA